MSVDPPAPIPSPRTTLTAVTGAIQKAAKATGASFDYLLATAKVESDLNPDLAMRSSSATGLFQFIEQTWLEVMKQAGNALGFGRYADAITETTSGRYEVADPAMRAEIMKLRKDPAANAAMGGMFTQQNATTSAQRLGRKPTDGELYVAHFFGPYSAAKVIRMAGTNPTANAAQMFPAAAQANRPIFYDKQGNARSVAGVYQELVRRYQVARASPTPGLTTRGCDRCTRCARCSCSESDPQAAGPARDCRGERSGPAIVASIDPIAGSAASRRLSPPRTRSRRPRSRRSGHRAGPRRRFDVSLPVPDRGAARRGRARGHGIVGPRQCALARQLRSRAPLRRRSRRPRMASAATSRRSTCSRTCPRTCAGCSAATSERQPPSGPRRINNPSIIPKIYGERFVKRRALG